MKQIFDWLREQIKNREITADFRTKEMIKNKDADGFEIQAGKQMAFLETLTLINEAEYKWKVECCEWKLLHEKCFIQNPHTKRMFSNEESMRNVYCNTCGKPIKISEVE